MFTKNHKSTSFRVALALALLAGITPIIPARACAEMAGETSTEAKALNQSGCQPDSGWIWTNGPIEPAIAAQAQEKLQ